MLKKLFDKLKNENCYENEYAEEKEHIEEVLSIFKGITQKFNGKKYIGLVSISFKAIP